MVSLTSYFRVSLFSVMLVRVQMGCLEMLIRCRIRLRFRKHGDLRYLSHLDLARTLERLFRRAGLKLGMSEGFHPKPRTSFPSALAVGVVGTNEIVELELAEVMDADEVLARLHPHCPEGIAFVAAHNLADGTRKANVDRIEYAIDVPPDRRPALEQQMKWFLAQESYFVRREKRNQPVDIRPRVESLRLDHGTLRMILDVQPAGSVRPRELLEALGAADLEGEGSVIARTDVCIKA